MLLFGIYLSNHLSICKGYDYQIKTHEAIDDVDERNGSVQYVCLERVWEVTHLKPNYQ